MLPGGHFVEVWLDSARGHGHAGALPVDDLDRRDALVVHAVGEPGGDVGDGVPVGRTGRSLGTLRPRRTLGVPLDELLAFGALDLGVVDDRDRPGLLGQAGVVGALAGDDRDGRADAHCDDEREGHEERAEPDAQAGDGHGETSLSPPRAVRPPAAISSARCDGTGGMMRPVRSGVQRTSEVARPHSVAPVPAPGVAASPTEALGRGTGGRKVGLLAARDRDVPSDLTHRSGSSAL